MLLSTSDLSEIYVLKIKLANGVPSLHTGSSFLSGMKNLTSYWHFHVRNLNMKLTKTSLHTGKYEYEL
jgi:hypothetical protein